MGGGADETLYSDNILEVEGLSYSVIPRIPSVTLAKLQLLSQCYPC